MNPRDGYHEFLRDPAEELRIVLIWDEVMTGFRLGPGSAQGRFGITPDMTTFAKVAGCGFQLGGFGGRREIMREIEPPTDREAEKWHSSAFHGGTYNGHPVSCAAGSATLEILDEEAVYETIEAYAETLLSGLQEVAGDLGVDATVEHVGSMGQVFMMDEAPHTYRDTWYADEDLFGNHQQFERFLTSHSNTDEQVAEALEIAEAAFRTVK